MQRTLTLALLAVLAAHAAAQLTLPYAGTDATATVSSFQITKSGASGRANTLYITNASNTSDALLVSTAGTGRAAYFTLTNASNVNPTLRADSNGSGISVFGFMTGTGRAGTFRITNANSTNSALYAQTNGSGPAFTAQAGGGLAGDFQGALRTSAAGIGIGTSGVPLFPLDFSETYGNKISLYGTNPGSHMGIGVQAGLLQIFTESQGSGIAFGYGGSGSMVERLRISDLVTLDFLSAGQDLAVNMRLPYDLKIVRDTDTDSSDAWMRVFTDNGAFEQMRIGDGDDAGTLFDGAVTANGIDFAEAFKVMDSSLEPGDLVVNHGLDWEYISKPSQAYDQRVIGVVSTKPAFIAGMSFDAEEKINPDLTRQRTAARLAGNDALEKELTSRMQELVRQAYRPIAFMGRVPVKVTGAVKPGDHLTASNIPGVAMAMTHAGQSVGIALEPNAGGYGKIMVMVQPGYFAPIAANQGAGRTNLEAKVERLVEENAELRARLDRLERSVRSR